MNDSCTHNTRRNPLLANLRCWKAKALGIFGTSLDLFPAIAIAAMLLAVSAAAVAAPAYNKRGLDVITPAQSASTASWLKTDITTEQLTKSAASRVVLPAIGNAELVTESVELLPSGNSRWTGVLRYLNQTGNQTFPATLILSKAGVLGDIRTNAGRFRFNGDASNGQTISLVQAAHVHDETCAPTQSTAPAGAAPKSALLAKAAMVAQQMAQSLASNEMATMDIMFVYTPRVAAKYGDQFTAVLDDLIESANTAAKKSQVQMNFRQVGAVKITPRRLISGDITAALQAVASSEDSSLPANADFASIGTKRAQLGADAVVFITAFGDYSIGCSAGSSCMVGAAFQATTDNFASDDPGKKGYAIVDVAAKDLAMTFVHELGHLLGAGHDIETGGQGLFDDSNGYRWDRGAAGDVMSYAPNRELLFSNPELTCGSGRCGAAADAPLPADNARALKSSRMLVANYRATKAAPLGDMTGLWTAQGDNSSLHLSQRGRVMTAVWTQFDSAGKPTWLMVPNCLVDGQRCKGDLYRSWAPGGSAADTAPLVPAIVYSGAIGAVDIDMSNAAQPRMRYDIYGDEKIATFGRAIAAAAATEDDQTVDGSWWMSMDQGPGLTVTRNQSVLHVQWFGFDGNGRATWYVAPGCQLAANNRRCTGELFQYTISAGGIRVTTPAAQRVGTTTLDFASAYAGTFSVDIAGRVRSANIERELSLD